MSRYSTREGRTTLMACGEPRWTCSMGLEVWAAGLGETRWGRGYGVEII